MKLDPEKERISTVSVLPIYTYDQPVLRKKAKAVKATDDALARFVDDMFETMHNANGIGLAANQVGSLQRLIVVDISDMEEWKEVKPLVLINPLVIEEEGLLVMEEGCLSIPEIKEEVERPESVRLQYKDMEMQDRDLRASGMLARVIQHEIDHLNGVLFIDHVGALKRKLLRGRLNKIRRGECDVNYPIVGGTVDHREPRSVESR